jgi:hypothetical protein
VQLYPASPPGAKATLDVTANRIGPGRYAATWDSSAVALGRYMVRWYYQVTSTSAWVSFDQEFEVANVPYQGAAYCTVYDLANDGMASANSGDGSAQKLIAQCSRYIEFYTGRTFSPTYKLITVSGTFARALLLDEPICAIEGLQFDMSGVFDGSPEAQANYRVFNRHLTQGLFLPDDRDNPKIEFLPTWDPSSYDGPYYPSSVWWRRMPRGVQNVQLGGYFGYTEPDGSMIGGTPALIRLACRLLCFKQQYAPGDPRRADAFNRQRLTSEYTRDQGYIMDKPNAARASPFVTHTLDPEIDAILFGFIRPPRLGAA